MSPIEVLAYIVESCWTHNHGLIFIFFLMLATSLYNFGMMKNVLRDRNEYIRELEEHLDQAHEIIHEKTQIIDRDHKLCQYRFSMPPLSFDPRLVLARS